MKKLNYLAVATAMALVVSAMSARAGVLYTTLGPSGEFDATNGYFVDGSNYFNQVLASPFTVSSTATLGIAELGLNNFAGSNSPVNLFVESDAGGQPGSILGSFTQVGTIPPFNSATLTSFTPNASLTLSTGTTYWLVAQEADPNTEQAWDYAYMDPINGLAFNQTGSATGPWTTFTDTDVAFRINSAVPEPSSFMLLAAGLLGVGAIAFARRRRLS